MFTSLTFNVRKRVADVCSLSIWAGTVVVFIRWLGGAERRAGFLFRRFSRRRWPLAELRVIADSWPAPRQADGYLDLCSGSGSRSGTLVSLSVGACGAWAPRAALQLFCVMHGRRWPLAGPRGGRRAWPQPRRGDGRQRIELRI